MTNTTKRTAEIVREYGPLEEGRAAHGVVHDGKKIWVGCGDGVHVIDRESGETTNRLPVAADAGTAFDGRHLYQLAAAEIQKVDAESGEVVATIPAPGGGRDSGLAWAEGTLWVGQYRDRKIHQIDPDSGAILRTIESDRFVTGVAWTDGELWHGAQDEVDHEVRRIDPDTGDVMERLTAPDGIVVSGISAIAPGHFLCGGGRAGKVRELRRPK